MSWERRLGWLVSLAGPAGRRPSPIVPAGNPALNPALPALGTQLQPAEPGAEPSALPVPAVQPPAPPYLPTTFDDADDPRTLMLNPNPDYPDKVVLSGPQRVLHRETTGVARLVWALFPEDKASRLKYFEKLKITLDRGIRDGDLDGGLDNIDEVKALLTSEFPKVRDRFWKKYFWVFTVLLALFGTLGLLLFYKLIPDVWRLREIIDNITADSVRIWIAVFWIPVGAAAGIFTEFFLRMADDIRYEELQAINPGRWNAGQRVMNVLVTAYLFAALMGIGVFQIGIGDIVLNDFLAKPHLALLIGFITGFAFPYVRDIIYRIRPAAAGQAARADQEGAKPGAGNPAQQ